MRVFKLLWGSISNFFCKIPRSLLLLGTCLISLTLILSMRIAHSAQELKYLGEIVKQERLILELEEGWQWQDGIMMKQHEAIQEQEAMLEYYKSIINDLMHRLNEKFKKERPNRSEATNYEKRTEYKNLRQT